MDKKDIEELKDRVGCGAVLEQAGFAIDIKESTRRAIKYRRGAEIIIVIHGAKGWFDPLSDAKGDVFSLVEHLEGGGFGEVLETVRSLIDFVPSQPIWKRQSREREADASVPVRWRARRAPWPGSSTWRYLADARALPDFVIRAALVQGLLREGPSGSMWAAHVDDHGAVTGWEERGPEWRGFASGGSKVLFRLGLLSASRFCVTEAAIDAMSLAVIEGLREDTLYVSTGGGWAPATAAAILAMASRHGALLVAATDANPQGDAFADRIRAIAGDTGCDFLRLRPHADDWNEDLMMRKEKKNLGGERDRQKLPHAHLPRQG